MMYTCDARGTCNPECPMYSVCHCGCGGKTTIERWNALDEGVHAGRPRCFVRYHHKRDPSVRYRGRKYTRSGIPGALVRADLRALVRLHGSQHKTALRLGVAQSWISHVLTGRYQRVSFGQAQRIAEAVRGGRDIAADWNKSYRTREKDKAKQRKRREGRRAVSEARPFSCFHCDSGFASSHALYLHSIHVHDDRTQGQHAWVTKRRVNA